MTEPDPKAVDVADEPPPPVRCQQCGDVIGMYEPLVLLTDSGRRETSLTAEPELGGAPSTVYHRACCAQAGVTR